MAASTQPGTQFPGQGRWSNGKHPFRALYPSSLGAEAGTSNAVTAAGLQLDAWWNAYYRLTYANGGGASSATPANTITRAVVVDLEVGDTVIVGVICDNAGAGGTSPIVSVDDSGGNTYTLQGTVTRSPGGVAGDGITMAIYTTTIVTPNLVSGGDGVFAFFSTLVTSSAIYITKFSGDTRVIGAVSSTSGSGTSASLTIPAASTLVNGSWIVAYVGVESADAITADADTLTGAPWGNLGANTASTGVSATSIATIRMTKNVAGPGAQSWDTSWATSTDYAAMAIVIGAVATPQSVTAQVATLSLTAVPGVPAMGAVSRTADPAAITLTAIPGIPTLGTVTQTAMPATLALTAVANTPTMGTATTTAQVATLNLTAIAGTPTFSTVSQAAQVAALTLTAVAGSPTMGTASQTATPAALTLTAVPGTPAMGAVAVAAQVAALTLAAVANTPTMGSVSVTATPAELSLTAVPGSPSIAGGVQSVTAQVATLTLTAMPGVPELATTATTAMVPWPIDRARRRRIGGRPQGLRTVSFDRPAVVHLVVTDVSVMYYEAAEDNEMLLLA